MTQAAAMTDALPRHVIDLMAAGIVAEWATLSKAGVPLDTPCYYFPSAGLATFDLATGLSYPAKAERARRNPKVGLLIEGGKDEPVISIAGIAAVRDADPQANALRYIAETGYSIPGDPTWDVARKAVYYWTRIIVEVAPARILWWENRAAMDEAPNVWTAPAGTVFPASDPAAPGAVSAPAQWAPKPWRETAEHAVARGAPAHLTMVDEQGFPLPIRVKAKLVEDGFEITAPRGAPWSGTGQASLSFEGLEVFIGEASGGDGVFRIKVERALPFHPLMSGGSQEMFDPSPETYGTLMRRLEHEAGRRGVPIPTIPEEKPRSTAGAKLREARLAMLMGGGREDLPYGS